MNDVLKNLFSLLDLLQDAACVIDEQGRVQRMNQTLTALLGVSAETHTELKLSDSLTLLEEESQTATVASLIQRIIDGGKQLQQIPALLTVADETQVAVAVTATKQRVGRAENGVLLILRDLTTLRDIEELSDRHARQFEEVQLLSNIGYWEWLPDSKTIAGGDVLNQLLARDSAETVTSIAQYLEWVHEDDRDRVEQLLKDATGDVPLNYTMRVKLPDSSIRTFSVFGEPVIGADGKLERMRGCTQDITNISETVRMLQQNQARFETIFEDAGIGIVLMDLDGTIVRANPAWEELMFVADDALTGENFNDMILPTYRPRCDSLFAELVSRHDPRGRYSLEVEFGRKDTDPIWINMIVSLIRDNDGKPRRAIAMLKDISVRYTTEMELREVKRRLARSREEERVRLAQELHDGPMQDLYATQFQLKRLNRYVMDAGKPTLQTIQNTFTQVNSTLRAIAGELRPPTLAPFGLEVAIRAYAETFQERYPNIQVSLDLMPDGQTLPDYVRLTLFRIQQESLNNIAKHAEAQHVAIELYLTESEIMLEIRDDGKGFDVPKRWIELARKDHFGLVGAAERAEEIDGTLVVLSSPGNGTTVRVTAPRSEFKE
jgi:PAS domain S-box-containing protein